MPDDKKHLFANEYAAAVEVSIDTVGPYDPERLRDLRTRLEQAVTDAFAGEVARVRLLTPINPDDEGHETWR